MPYTTKNNILNMNFDFALDKDYEINLEGLSGEFKIIGDDNNIIQESNVYIDDWLNALVEGFKILESENSNQRIEMDLESEPDPLELELRGEFLTIIYKNNSVKVNSFQEAKTKLKNKISLIFNELVSVPNWEEDINLKPLINYLK